MEFDVELATVIKDADDNFQTGRYRDAYQHYKTIVRKLLGDEDLPHGIYFTYRSLLCLQDDDHIEQLRELINLGLFLVKYSLFKTNQLISSTRSPRKSIKLLDLQERIVSDLNLLDLRKSISDQRLENLSVISREHDITIDEQIEVLKKMYEIEPSSELKVRLRDLLIEKAKNVEDDEISIYIKLQLYKEALDYTEEPSDVNNLKVKVDELQMKIDKI